MPGSLDTTNTMLAIIAAVSVLQGLVLIGLGVAGWKIYKLASDTIREIDEKRVQPIAAKVNGLVDRAHQVTDKVHAITDKVQHRAEKVEAALDTAKTEVSGTVQRVASAVSGLRGALVDALTTHERGRVRTGNGHAHESHQHIHHGEGGF